MTFRDELTKNIKRSQKQQRASRDTWKPISDFFVEHNSKPSDEKTERRSEEHVSATGKRGDRQRPRMIPVLRSGGKHKGQPMGRNGGVEKRDAEACDRNCGENRLVHSGPECRS